MKFSHLLIGIIASLMAMALHSCSDSAGTEVANEHTFALYKPDGTTPVANAEVRVFRSSDTSHIPVFEAETDANGNCIIKGEFTDGEYYNITAEAGSLVSFQDSVLFGENIEKIENDTMNVGKNVSGIVKLNVNHNVQTVTVHVLGTFTKTGVNEDGSFTLSNLAHGKYTVMCISTIDEYTPLYYELTVTEETKAIPDTLKPVYTGIPIVHNLIATVDTLAGSVTLNWDKSTFFDLQDYRIFRIEGTSTEWPTTPFATTTDTFFTDNLYDGTELFGESTAKHYKYRVQISNNANQVGNPYKYEEINTISPTEAQQIVAKREDLLNPDGSITLKAIPGSWFGANPKVSWDLGNTGNFVILSGTDTTLAFPEDTLLVNHKCVVKVEGVNDRTVVDTVTVSNLLKYKEIKTSYGSDIEFGKVVIFNNRVLGFDLKKDFSLGLMASSDGKDWERVVDIITKPCSIQEHIIWNNKLILFTYDNYEDNNWANFITIDENFTITHTPISNLSINDINALDECIYLNIENNRLVIHSPEGNWSYDENLSFVEKVDPIENFVWFNPVSDITLNNKKYKLCAEYTWSDGLNNPFIFEVKGETELIKIKEFAKIDSTNQDWTRNFTRASNFKDGAILFRPDSNYDQCQQVLYSENMIDWYKVADLPESNFYDPVNLNGKLLIFCSKGKILTL